MSKHEMVKAVFGKPKRSGFHLFLTSVFPMNRTSEAGFDVLGSVIVVSSLMGMMFMMRLLLAH
jgi:hypothetical protein